MGCCPLRTLFLSMEGLAVSPGPPLSRPPPSYFLWLLEAAVAVLFLEPSGALWIRRSAWQEWAPTQGRCRGGGLHPLGWLSPRGLPHRAGFVCTLSPGGRPEPGLGKFCEENGCSHTTRRVMSQYCGMPFSFFVWPSRHGPRAGIEPVPQQQPEQLQ